MLESQVCTGCTRVKGEKNEKDWKNGRITIHEWILVWSFVFELVWERVLSSSLYGGVSMRFLSATGVHPFLRCNLVGFFTFLWQIWGKHHLATFQITANVHRRKLGKKISGKEHYSWPFSKYFVKKVAFFYCNHGVTTHVSTYLPTNMPLEFCF